MLEIRLLGHYKVKRDGELVEIASRPSRILLAYLALTAGTRHPRERLAGLLWPDSDELNARSNLRQALWRLRKSIGDEYLLADKQTLTLNPDAEVWLDTAILRDSRENDLEQVLALYEGELLPGYYEEWVLLERERLQAAYERKIQAFLDNLIEEQRWSDTVHWAERWIAFGQVPEPAYRALMRAHAAQGDLAAVSAAYDRCATALRLEVGVEPSAETRGLLDQLLQATETSPVERLTGEDVPDLEPPRHNLVRESPTFIGRDRELAQLQELLSESRLLTIVGPGGTGKTRLAVMAATEMLGRFQNGVYFVSLAPIESPELITQTIAETIGFPLSSHEDPRQQLLRHLRNREYLLLLDNFEHLLSGAAIASEITQDARRVKILATSRERLNLRGETLFRIDGLQYPDSPFAPDALEYSAVKLFVGSARRLRPGFTAGPENLPHSVEICQLLEGMPLGILLAAAWVDTLTPQEIANEIGRSLDFLQVDWQDAPSRHHSVRAAFEPSWDRLSRDQRELFAALSVFRGGFTREAAEAAAGASLAGLVELVNKSLVRRDLESGRYDIHELLRQYAQEKLEEMPERRLAVRRAHAKYFAQVAQQGWFQLIGREAQRALAVIDADLENLRIAWRYWLDRNDILWIRMFLDCFWRVYHLRGWYNAGERLFDRAAKKLRIAMNNTADEEIQVLYARVLAHQAYFLTQMGYIEASLAQVQEGVDIIRRLNRPEELAFPLTTLLWDAAYVEDVVVLSSYGLSEVEFTSEPDSQWKRAYVHSFQSRGTAVRGESEHAERMIQESLQQFERLGDPYAIVWPVGELGNLAIKRGSFLEAREHYRQYYQTAKNVGFGWGIVKTTRYLGYIESMLGEYEVARSYLHTSLRIADELGMIRDVVSALYDLGSLEAAVGNVEQAVRLMSTVQKHPLSNQARSLSRYLGERQTRFRDLAEVHLKELEVRMTPEEYLKAREVGRGMTLDATVRELLSASAYSDN